MNSRNFSIFILIVLIATLYAYLPSVQNLSSSPKKSSPKDINQTAIPVTPKESSKELADSVEAIENNTEQTDAVPEKSSIPNFAAIKDVKLKKKTFFKFMNKNIILANQKITSERAALLSLIKSYNQNQAFSLDQQKSYSQFSKKYRVDKSSESISKKLELLLEKVDVVPTSLILAQSANESAWGTSRFATKGNNYFGQWCYSKGCGLVPASRDSGASHEVAKFSSVQKSVEEYIYNINVGRSYKKIRQLRQQMNNDNKPVDSLLLATGLVKYSERGEEYVKEIQAMIRFNKLQEYD